MDRLRAGWQLPLARRASGGLPSSGGTEAVSAVWQPAAGRRRKSTTARCRPTSGRSGGRRTRPSGASRRTSTSGKQMNTAVSAMMELVNDLYAFTEKGAPHGAGRAGRRRGDRGARRDAVAVRAAYGRGIVGAIWPRRRPGRAAWPTFDPDVARAESIVVPVQVNGKVRGRITVTPERHRRRDGSAGAGGPGLCRPYLKDREVTKVVVAKGRLVSMSA